MFSYEFAHVIINVIFLIITSGMLLWSIYDCWKWAIGERNE